MYIFNFFYLCIFIIIGQSGIIKHADDLTLSDIKSLYFYTGTAQLKGPVKLIPINGKLKIQHMKQSNTKPGQNYQLDEGTELSISISVNLNTEVADDGVYVTKYFDESNTFAYKALKNYDFSPESITDSLRVKENGDIILVSDGTNFPIYDTSVRIDLQNYVWYLEDNEIVLKLSNVKDKEIDINKSINSLSINDLSLIYIAAKDVVEDSITVTVKNQIVTIHYNNKPKNKVSVKDIQLQKDEIDISILFNQDADYLINRFLSDKEIQIKLSKKIKDKSVWCNIIDFYSNDNQIIFEFTCSDTTFTLQIQEDDASQVILYNWYSVIEHDYKKSLKLTYRRHFHFSHM